MAPIVKLYTRLEVPVGVSLVHAPVPSWAANHTGKRSDAQNVQLTLPVPPPPPAVTVPASVALTLANPLAVPVTVAEKEPVAAADVAVKVSVDVVPVTETGLNVAVTPLGKPVTARLTAPVKPPVRVMVTVLAPVPPCCSVAALAFSENPAGAETVTASVTLVLVTPVPDPPTVML